MRADSSPMGMRLRPGAVTGLLLLLGWTLCQTGVSGAQEVSAPEEAAAAETAPAGEPAAEAPPETPPDLPAAAFMMKCMGCHTLGGGALTGPDLKNALTYPRATVRDGVKRMEKSVGPLRDEEVEMFTEFLLSPDAGARIETQREQVQMREAASLEPANAEKGKALFFGRTAFTNGGAACSACHQAGGWGGNLAASLEDAFTRLGEQPLLATTETPGFPVMRAIYTEQPVAKQEALHVVKYLEEISKQPSAPARVPMHLLGAGGAVAVMVLLGRLTRKRAAGIRARLVAGANRRADHGRPGRRRSS